MNKLKLISVALVCALGLGVTSCVDDEESASVENLRNQKAEQLKALAAYQNAQAEAELILANAEAAIKAAEAEALRIKNELDGVELEIAKAGLDARLEAARLEAEAALQRAKASLEAAKAQLIAALDQVSEAEKLRVTVLLGKAETALQQLNGAKSELIAKQAAKVRAEYSLTDYQITKNQTLATNMNLLATQHALLAEYEKYSQEDKANAQKAADEAEAKSEGLYQVYVTAFNAYLEADKAKSEAQSDVDGSEFVRSLDLYSAGTYSAYNYVENKVYVEGGLKTFTYDDEQLGGVYTDNIYHWIVKTDLLSAEVADASRKVTVAETVLKEANKALTDKKAEQGYKDAKEAVEKAKKAFNDATTSSDKEAARIDLQNAEYFFNNYAATEEQNVENAEIGLQNARAALQEIEAIETFMTGKAAEVYNRLVDALKEASAAETDKKIGQLKAHYNWTVQHNLALHLAEIADNMVDYAELIAGVKAEINRLEGENADYENIHSQEELVRQLEAEIVQLEAKVTALENIYNAYKAQIDALLAE